MIEKGEGRKRNRNNSLSKANSCIMRGGIYLASSLAGTSRAWDCRVARQAIGRLGDVEPLTLWSNQDPTYASCNYWFSDQFLTF